MNIQPCKIAVAGAHSTGKSTFLRNLRGRLRSRGVQASCVHVGAKEARALGFPILDQHTFESTTWIIAETIRREVVASLNSDVILVDRPVPDALGYLVAALEYTDRRVDDLRLARLQAICASWACEYDRLFLTELDASVPLAGGRDADAAFRAAAGEAIERIVGRVAPGYERIRRGREEDALRLAVGVAMRSYEGEQ